MSKFLNNICFNKIFQTKKAPVNEYQMIREKAASQKRDVERALTRFIAKTGETQSLFRDDTITYPCKAQKSGTQNFKLPGLGCTNLI